MSKNNGTEITSLITNNQENIKMSAEELKTKREELKAALRRESNWDLTKLIVKNAVVAPTRTEQVVEGVAITGTAVGVALMDDPSIWPLVGVAAAIASYNTYRNQGTYALQEAGERSWEATKARIEATKAKLAAKKEKKNEVK